MSAAPASTGSANCRLFGIGLSPAPLRNAPDHAVEYLQHVLALLFAQAIRSSRIVLYRFSDDETLRFLQPGSRSS